MRFSFFSPVLALFWFLCGACSLSAPAFADSYTIYRVAQSSGSIGNVGLADDGSLTIYKVSAGPYGNPLWETFTPPGSTTTSTSQPSLTFDNGSSCSVSLSGLSAYNAKCNGQYSLFNAYTATSVFPTVYVMSGNTLLSLYFGGGGGLLINAFGDVAFISLAGSDRDVNFLYYNNTSHAAAAITPEPLPLVLLLTGFCCYAVFHLRRRLEIA